MDPLMALFQGMPVLAAGTLASLLAGLCTGIGALPVFVVRRLSPRTEDALLGFSAGIMLAASFFSLILPALEAASAGEDATSSTAAMLVATGILGGAVALWLIHRVVPHEHFIMGHEGPDSIQLKRMWLFVLAITLHNFPEGMAVGVGFGGENTANGISLMVGIGLQNMPEGLAVAVAMTATGFPRRQAFLVALLTGLVEPVGGLFGVGTVSLAANLLPWGLALSAGAMLFVISDEIIPETHRREFTDEATFSLMGGFVVMMYLDFTLG